jgi:hypothetical protein
MTKDADDDTTSPSAGALPALKTIIFLPGATPGLAVDGVQRSEGWVGQCPAPEADDLCSRRLAVSLPDDWPALPPPADGEPLPAYIAHTVDGHPSVLAIMKLGEPVGLKAPIQNSVRPKEMTTQKWELKFAPDRRFHWIDNHPRQTVLFHFSEYLRQRLLVELFDRLRAGTWCLNGHKADDLDYASHPVPPGRFGHPDMVLHHGPGGDWFRPMQRHGWPVPAASLPSVGGLTLHPHPAADAAPLNRTGAQGHPSSMTNLVAPELTRRAAAGETLSTMKAEAAALSKWLANEHPRQPQAKPRAIENALRGTLRTAVNAAKERGI